jgi:hypothetical protein
MQQMIPVYKPEVVIGVTGYEIHKYYWTPNQDNRGFGFVFAGVVETGVSNEDVNLFLDVLHGTDAKVIR